MIHYTTEDVVAMPGYCRDRYEREILRLENQIIQAQKAVGRIPFPHTQAECFEKMEEIKIAIKKTMVTLILDNPKEGKQQ